MPHILQLRGPRAVSEFRHFIELERELAPQERTLLERLLAYGNQPIESGGRLYLVVPRLGTISPWSSKATDIAHNCGLAAVKRVERGTAYYMQSEHAGIAALLHDRMTQTVLSSFDQAAQLFAH
ncbi:MAG TPA: hypothetical protein VE325_02225, partial [Burkholderiales bacterium]|nr:hypothetical protein [Burkholderiales bacterium]